jgi:hypothetical protein
VIQSCNGSNEKSQILEDDNFTKSPFSMMKENFEHHNLVKKLIEEHILIFDDIIYA